MKRETSVKFFNWTLIIAVVAIIMATIINYRNNGYSTDSQSTGYASEKDANIGIKLTSHISSSYASDLYYFNDNPHLFCAGRGGYQTFKTTINYSGTTSMGDPEFEWIMNNIFDVDDCMPTQDKADMLGLDYNTVSRVYGNKETRYILHQFLVWRYSNHVTVGGDVGKVCDAIVSLARRSILNGGSSSGTSSGMSSSRGITKTAGTLSTATVTFTSDGPYGRGNYTYGDGGSYGGAYSGSYGSGVSVTKVDGDNGHFDSNGVFVWNVAIYSTSDYEKTVYVDGRQTTNYTYSNSTLMVYGVTPGNHNFKIEAKAPTRVSSSYVIHTTNNAQPILEVTSTGTRSGGYDYEETSVSATGKFSVNIKKVNPENQPVSGAVFNVNGTQCSASNENGIIPVNTNTNIASQNLVYTYTISEVNSGKDLVKFKDNVVLNLYSGLKTVNGATYYAITKAMFETSGTNVCDAYTENGDRVEIRADMSYDDANELTTITITVPNPYKKYDLALTKTMILNKEEFIEKYDVNRDGECNAADVLCITSLRELENTGSTYRDYNNHVATWTAAYNSYYKYLVNTAMDVNDDMRYKGIYDRIKQFVFEITGDESSNYETTANKLTAIIEANSEDGEINRLNSIYTNRLNVEPDTTTATYNLNKSTRVVKKNSIITYKYSVYNECEYDGKDVEITDYLPAGLKLCDENGNVVTSGNVTCKYNGVDYVWNVEGNKAKIRINKTIGKYDGQDLKRESVYMTCKLDDSVMPGNILYNASEISDSTPIDSDGNPVNVVDRDSVENSIETETENDVVNKYKNRFENKEREGTNASDVIKSTYEYQDDDDFERIVILDQKFDLALRKSITKFGDSEANMEAVPGTADSNDGNRNANSRLPKLTFDSASVCLATGTGEYYHGKRYVEVKAEDYVEYTIRVYNEGSREDYDGYAKQITDYLPAELEFAAVVDANGQWITNATNGKYVTSSNSLGHYEVSYDSAQNKVVINCVDTPVLYTRNNLGDIATYDDSAMQTYYNIGNGSVDQKTYGYQEVKIVCKLKNNAPISKYITNIAEITDDVAVDSDGVIVDINDNDSTPSSINIGSDVNLENFYENRGIDDIHIDYYEGIQDDDDFETVLIDVQYTPVDYRLKVKKVDEELNELTGARFSLTRNSDNLFENNGNVDADGYTSTYSNGVTEAELKDLFYTGTTDIVHSYVLKEEEAPQRYIKLKNSMYIDYHIKIKKESNMISAEMNTLGIYADGGYRSVEFSYPADLGKKKTLENVLLENGETCNIEVSLKSAGTLVITVVNKPNIKGSYKLKLKKMGTDGEQLEDVRFTASGKFNGSLVSEAIPRSGEYVVTSADRMVSLVPERYTDGTIKIDPEKYTTPDQISLEEFDIDDDYIASNYYLGLKDKTITVKINKDKKIEDDAVVYYVKSVGLEVDGQSATKISDTEYRFDAENGSRVNVRYIELTQTVLVTVTNPTIDAEGAYSLQVEKRGLEYVNGEYVVGDKLEGVTFTATANIDGKDAPISQTGYAVNGKSAIKSPVQTTGNGSENVYVMKNYDIRTTKKDTIKLKETDIGPNFGHYIGTDKNIVIEVDKEKEQVTEGGVTKDVYRITDVHLSMEATSSTRLAESTDKSVTFKNGTKIQVSMEGQTIKLVVVDPVKEGKYDINLVKYAKGDTNHPVSDVKFTATGVFNGAPPLTIATEQDPILTSNAGPVEVKSNVKITSNIDEPDIITLREFNVGSNNDMYIGITGDIQIYVYKETDDSIATNVVNRVKRIALKVNGQNVEAESDTKSRITLDNGAQVIVEYNHNTESVDISVVNPKVVVEGQYSIQIEKRAPDKLGDIYAEGQKLSGVTFTATGSVDGHEAPVSAIGFTADNNVAIKSPITTTGDNEDNPYIIKDMPIRTTTQDEFRIVETSIGNNSHFYVGTDKPIVLSVTKTKETVIENGVTKEVYKPTSVSLVIDQIDSSEIEEQTATKVELKNGTVVEASLENNTITVVVTDPTKKGDYRVNLVKYSTADRTTPVAGVKFTATATIDGVAGNEIATEQDPIVTRAGRPVTVKSNVKMENAIDQADKFVLREFDTGDNEGMYLGITGDIELTVHKAADDSDPSGVVNKVSSIELKVNGQTANANNKIVLANGAEASVTYNDNTKTIEIVVVNPVESEEGEYSLELEKRGLKYSNGEFVQGDRLEGVKFTVSGSIDGANIPATASGLYEGTQKGIRSPVYTTAGNSINAVVVDKKQIRTELEDTFRFNEVDIGYNDQYYLGTDKTIVVKVQKTKEVIETAEEHKTIYKATGATVSIEGIDASAIKSQIATRIELVNGTIVEVSLNNKTVKLLVVNPVKRGEYNLNILKYAKSDKNHPVSGVEFTATAEIEGKYVTIADTESPIVTSNAGPVEVKSNIEIKDVNKVDTYRINEYSLGPNNNLYKGINGNIIVKVGKVTDYSDPTRAVNKVDNIEISVDGKTASISDINENSENIQEVNIELDNGAEVGLKFNKNTQTIEIAAVNQDIVQEGMYSLQIEKRAPDKVGNIYADGQKISGVWFQASGIVDGNEMPVHFTGRTGDDKVAVKSPISSTGDNEENPYIVQDVPIRTTITDTFKVKETSLGTNLAYVIGTDKNIVVQVQKSKTIESDNGVVREIYAVTGASVSIEGIDQSLIKSQTPTQIKLINGTIVEVKLENGTITLTVTDPIKEGTYNLNVVKYSALNRNTPVGGVKFTAVGVIDGVSSINIADENRPIVTSEAGAVPIKSNIRMANAVGQVDRYHIEEIDLGPNNDMYIGITEGIDLTVSKMVDDSDPNNVINKVESVYLSVNNQAATQESDTKASIALDNGTEVVVEYNDDTETIELTIVNPVVTKEGKYSVQLEKRAPDIIGDIYADGQKLKDVKFEVSGKIDGVQMPVSSTGRTANNELAVRSPVYTIDDENENVYVVKDAPISTTEEDIYTFKEKSIGANKAFYIGTDKDIILHVQKTKEIVTNNGVTKEIFKPSGATLEFKDTAQIESQTDTRIKLINGTVIEVNFENNTVTLIVTNPRSKGKYDINLTKYAKGDRSSPVGGVKFTASSIANGRSQRIIADEDEPLVTSDEGPVAIDRNVPIENSVEDPDIYYLNEIDIGPNQDMYIGIRDQIAVYVYKETVAPDGINEVRRVREVALKINNRAVAQETIYKSNYIAENGAVVTVEYNQASNTVEVSVENPKPVEEGKYSVQIEKRAPDIIGNIYADGQKLSGVWFQASGVVDGKEMPVHFTGRTGDNSVAVKSPISSTGDGEENPYIVQDVPIRTTSEDTFTLKETSVGQNSSFTVGTDKNILLHVQKAKNIVNENGVAKEVYSVTGASISIDDIDSELIAEQTPTRIKLVNGTIIEVNVENNNVTVIVTDPIREGRYNLSLVKYSAKDKTTPAAGVKFTAVAVIDGVGGINIADEDNPIVTSDRGAVPIKTGIRMAEAVGQADRFYIREIDAGPNEGMILGITGDIELTVLKEEDTSDPANVINKIKTIYLRVNDYDAEQESPTKARLLLANGTEVTVEYNDETQTIELTVVNPCDVQEGQYSVQLEKRAPDIIGDIYSDGQKLEGVEFEASGTIDGVTMPVTETGLTNDGKVAILSPAVTTGEGRENVYIVKDAPIRTTTEDVYRIKETKIGPNSKYYLGTNKDIILRVQKSSEIVSRNGVNTEVFKATGATISISGMPSSQIESETPTRIKLVNKTIVEVSLENNVVTLTVTNPVRKGTYDVELVKYSTGNRNTPIGGVKFTASAQMDGQPVREIADEDEPLVTSSEGPVVVRSNIGMENHIDVPDKFTLREFDVGQNPGISLGITGDIELTVYKEAYTAADGYAYNRVREIALSVNGENVEQESLTKSKIVLDNGAEVIVEYVEATQTIEITAINPSLPGKFGLNLIKTIKGEQDPNDLSKQKPLPGAKFRITISDGDNVIYNSDDTSTDGLVTDSEGKITGISGLDIEGAGKTYTVTVEELSAPEGYIGLGRGNVKTFTVRSISENGEYKLESKDKTPIQNDSNIFATVSSDSILIEAENLAKPEIHKGVKRVDNQSSGYDKNEIQTWVVETTVPYGISEYTKYIVKDEIDYEVSNVADKRIKFVNEENPESNVVVKVKETGEVLTAGTDYLVEFTSGKVLILTFIDSENSFVAGRSMDENTTLEIKYNTQFVLNDDGSVKCINTAIPNKAVLEYEVNNQDEDIPSENPEVHTGGLGVFKYDRDTNRALQGAHFKLTRTRAEADKAVSAILENDSSKLAEVRFVKVIDSDGNETDADVELVTGADGYAFYTGLEFGEDAMDKVARSQDPITGANVYRYDWQSVSTTYYLVETVVPDEYLPLEQSVECEVKYDNFSVADLTTYHKVGNKPKYYDLSLRKFITNVNDKIIDTRIPKVTLTDDFKNDVVTTAQYEHTKEPVVVENGDIVTYTIRIYNEGPQDAYASIIKDDIPDGVVFVPYTEGDGSVNDHYRWKLVDENDNEVSDVSRAKYIVSDYLSMERGTVDTEGNNSNLLKAYNKNTMSELDHREVKVQFRVIEPNTSERILINYAQIAKMTNSENKVVTDRDSTPNVWIEGEDDQDIEKIRLRYMDLALRKFITGVTDGATGIHQAVDTRYPQVNAQALIDRSSTTADYIHPKDPVLVHTTDTVIYTIRVYNEGNMDGYATVVKDDMPEGLEFLPDHEINKWFEWSLVDANDNHVTDIKDATYVVTNYLSKVKESDERPNLIKAFDRNTMTTPDFKEVKIAFKVTEPQTSDRILVNKAQITEQTDKNGEHKKDIDSTPNVWLGEDDEDFENVRVKYFDLALRKWVTKAIVTENGKTVVTETGHQPYDDPEDVVKVDLKKSKLDEVVVKFEYQIRIINEGEIAGYAKEIKDHIPQGLKFDPADNPTWTQLEENIITTDELKDTLLEPGECAEVTVVLTWINSGTNLGLKVNIAEISEDYNDYHTPDIDSTPNNFVPGEDDIDDAPVMLAVTTGDKVVSYVALGLAIVAIAGIVVKLVKIRGSRDA